MGRSEHDLRPCSVVLEGREPPGSLERFVP